MYKLNDRILRMGDRLFATGLPKFPTSGLTSYWSFQTTGVTIQDSVSGITGYVNNTALFTTLGKRNNGLMNTLNQGASFSGYIKTTQQVRTDYGATISWWMKKAPTWNPNTYQYNIGIRDSNSGDNINGFSTQINLGLLTLTCGDGRDSTSNSRYQFTYNNTFIGTDWYHYVATLNGTDITSMKLYENGVECTNKSQSGSATYIHYHNKIISMFTYFPNIVFTSGTYIDEVGTWNRPLTQAEVTALYDNGNGLFY